MADSFPNLAWLDGERVEGRGEEVRTKKRELDRQLERLEAVGKGEEEEGGEGTRAMAEEEGKWSDVRSGVVMEGVLPTRSTGPFCSQRPSSHGENHT